MFDRIIAHTEAILNEINKIQKTIDDKTAQVRAQLLAAYDKRLRMGLRDSEPITQEQVQMLEEHTTILAKLTAMRQMIRDVSDEVATAPALPKEKQKRRPASPDAHEAVAGWVMPRLNAKEYRKLSGMQCVKDTGVGLSTYNRELKNMRNKGMIKHNGEFAAASAYILTREPNYAVARAALTAQEMKETG